MNLFFVRPDNPRQAFRVPARAYARLDHLEFDDEAQRLLASFDLIDADWVDDAGRESPFFRLDEPEGIAAAWRRRSPREDPNPFERAPLFQLEVELTPGGVIASLLPYAFQLIDPEWRAEDRWLDIRLEREKPGDGFFWPADLYPTLFSDPQQVFAFSSRVKPPKAKALSAMCSLSHYPVAGDATLRTMFAGVQADLLAVYDVGQGSANALLDMSSGAPEPTLYYDVGGGIKRNHRTRPPKLDFCFRGQPPIVLSHWDKDHWAGVTGSATPSPALQCDWLVPDQPVPAGHAAFAASITGQVWLFKRPPPAVAQVTLPNQRTLRLTLGDSTSQDRNLNGIVMEVQAQTPTPRCWLLTGDCEYANFLGHLQPLEPVGLVVPHHGATLHGHTPAPMPVAGYRRIAYSFGECNRHGPTNVQHPTAMGVACHAQGGGWQHGGWHPANAVPLASVAAGGDVLSTNLHVSGARGSALIGWSAPPTLPTAPCQAWGVLPCGAACSTQFIHA